MEKAPVFGYSANGASNSSESTRRCAKCTISHPKVECA